MNEKNIELSNLNSPNNNTLGNFSFSKNQTQENNAIITEENALYNTPSNMTIDINNNTQITRARGFSNIDHNKKNRTKKERSINLNSIKNFGKKLYICIFILLSHLNILSERKISVQVGIVYTLLMVILTMGVAYIKIIHIMDIINSLTNKNYFLFYVNNIIDSQREIKLQLDELNNHDIVSTSNDPLLFYRIYTEELVNNKILNRDSLILEQNLEKQYSDLGKNYELSDDLYKLADIYNEYSAENDLKYNIKNMLPFYYHFTPIIINHFNNCGIKLSNFYFIARGEYECTNQVEEKDTINKMYFKYPLESLNLGPDKEQKYMIL